MKEALKFEETEESDDLEMMPDDDEGVISKSNTQRIPVSLIKHLQKVPSLIGTRNEETSVRKSSATINVPIQFDLAGSKQKLKSPLKRSSNLESYLRQILSSKRSP
jgi:hypothetical protein